jgi:hypothetical protein
MAAMIEILERDPRAFAPVLAPDVGGIVAEALAGGVGAEDVGLARRAWTAADRAGFAEPALKGVLEGMRRAHETAPVKVWSARLAPLLVSMFQDMPGAVVEVLRATPTSKRTELTAALLESASQEQRMGLAEKALVATEVLDDLAPMIPLVGVVAPARMLDIADRVLERIGAETGSGNAITRILKVMGPVHPIEWLSRHAPEKRVSPILIEAIAHELPEPDVAAPLLPQLLVASAGIVVLTTYSASHPAWNPESLLQSHPEGVQAVLRLAAKEPYHTGFERLIPIAASVAGARTVIELFNPELSDEWLRAPWSGVVASLALLAVVRLGVSGEPEPPRLRLWLAALPQQAWLRVRNEGSIEAELASARGSAAQRAMELLTENDADALRRDTHLIRTCLEAFSKQSISEIAPLAPSWARLLEGITDAEIRAEMCALALDISLKHPDPALAPLAEVAFATVHKELLQGARFGFSILRWLRALFDDDWDRAGRIRGELARAWVVKNWSPLSLLRAAAGDEELFADLARRAYERPGGETMLRKLYKAARSAAGANPEWTRMLARLPRSVREEYD